MVVTSIVGFLVLATLALFGIGCIVTGFIFRKLKRPFFRVMGTILIVSGLLFATPAVSCTALAAAAWIRHRSDDFENKGPLLRAIEENDLEKVEALVSEGADVNAEVKRYRKMTPLSVAACLGRLEITRFLIRMHADVNKPCGENNDQLPLFEAVRHDDKAIEGDNIQTIDELLRHGAEPSRADQNENALHHAVRYNSNPAVIKLLLDRGVDINARSAAGHTALMITTFVNGQTRYKIPFAKLLIAHGAKVNVRDNRERTALDHAEDADFDEMSEVLRAFGAKTGKELEESGR